MELGLGHRLDQPPERSGRSGGSRHRRRCYDAGASSRGTCALHVHHPRHRRERLRRQPHRPGAARRPGTGSSPSRTTPDGGRRRSSRGSPARTARASRSGSATSTGPRRSSRRSPASTPSSTSSRSRATSTAAPTSASSTPRARGRASRRWHAAGVRRLVHMGALGVVDDPTLHYASSKAQAEALVAASDLDWTILKPSLQFGEGDGFFNIVAGLVRMSPGVVPVPGDGLGAVPADPRRRRRRGRRRGSLADPTTIGGSRSSSAGRATGRTARSPPRSPRRSASGGRSCRCRSRSSASSPATAEFVHLPFPVATDQLRQLRLDNIGPLDLIPTRFGFTPRPMEGALGYLRTKAAGPAGRHSAMRPTPRRRRSAAARLAGPRRGHRPRGGRDWSAAMDNPPGGSAAEPDQSAAGDAEVTPQLDAAAGRHRGTGRRGRCARDAGARRVRGAQRRRPDDRPGGDRRGRPAGRRHRCPDGRAPGRARRGAVRRTPTTQDLAISRRSSPGMPASWRRSTRPMASTPRGRG